MSANSSLTEALGVLDEKLQSLNAMMLANQFLVDAMRNHKITLNALDAEAARSFLRQLARKQLCDDDANEDVLTLLLQILAPHKTADIIPFPKK